MHSFKNWHEHELKITSCKLCPRLIQYCRQVAQDKRRAFINEEYWGKPVPPFGDKHARLVIVGLAPAAHGGNRTGRMFTGDRSGDWLYRALYKAGFANQPTSVGQHDGLQLKDTIITATAHCAPPLNKPTTQELKTCVSTFLEWEIHSLKNAQVYLGLGKVAFDQLWKTLKKFKFVQEGLRAQFKHGVVVPLKQGRWLLGSYHPSQQNTFTGKLTLEMFDSIFEKARKLLR